MGGKRGYESTVDKGLCYSSDHEIEHLLSYISKSADIDRATRTCNGNATNFSGGTTSRAWDEMIRGRVRASSACMFNMDTHSRGDYWRTSALGNGLELLAPGIG